MFNFLGKNRSQRNIGLPCSFKKAFKLSSIKLQSNLLSPLLIFLLIKVIRIINFSFQELVRKINFMMNI